MKCLSSAFHWSALSSLLLSFLFSTLSKTSEPMEPEIDKLLPYELHLLKLCAGRSFWTVPTLPLRLFEESSE